MTLRSRLPLYLYQNYFLIKEFIESSFRKLEVITDSNVIIYSVRILIVLLALLMGYIHTPKANVKVSNVNPIEISSQQSAPIFEELKR